MTRRWTEQEEAALREVRKISEELLYSAPQFPEVVGDRRILRFLRGMKLNVEEGANMYCSFLLWRKEFNVDKIRQEIVYGGRNDPHKFPFADKILPTVPQIVIAPDALDYQGRPLVFEQFGFNPKEMLKIVPLKDYLTYLIYCMEFRALILEQLSEQREREYLLEHSDPDTRTDGYGIIVNNVTIRDLKNINLSHLGHESRLIIRSALDMATPNYPEFLGRSHMVNVPWIFNSMWYFIKNMLDESTLAKFTMSSSSESMRVLQAEMPMSSIPNIIGGEMDMDKTNGPFDFDTAENGALHYAYADSDRDDFYNNHPEFNPANRNNDNESQTVRDLMAGYDFDDSSGKDNDQSQSPQKTSEPINNPTIDTTAKESKTSSFIIPVTTLYQLKELVVSCCHSSIEFVREGWNDIPLQVLYIAFVFVGFSATAPLLYTVILVVIVSLGLASLCIFRSERHKQHHS